ncbi:MAG: hypothetical protein KZQ64_01570 [gamma proteobacterium symbiont of Bathyaustriella thionipta]|nr:hypothetical protein [gamma proteobacterium symbiont of Bathyaustriella thionipta]MCU7950218.1 hypothetical protein [gamma proteobacterium symbiont of Bathyaustriella thionipta]MCU7952085.1 hypothetical protein [gamma proteobacterium symbiont of Bathyaustriella thionipta]MCU7956755.1 hypothetical protein [gamma proteobacterium symbiont of Bathyaustriella thionipta]MCU7965976.1 hypothetical protein [gamma proteobacterium symbiont of Bathyaustriella thionipta]
MIYEQSSGTQKSANTMQIKNGKIRFTPPDQDDNYSLFDSKTIELTHVDTAKKQYLTMDEKIIEQQANQAKQQMDMMRQRMMEKMKDMPPEQKQQVEQMMNNHLSRVETEKTPPKLEQKKTTRTKTVSGIQCTVHESYLKGIKHSELCIATPAQIGLNNDDAQTLMSMQEFMKRMQKMAQSVTGSNAAISDIQGIPLHTTLYGPDGSIKLETRLTSISTDALSNETITIPADFSPMPIPEIPKMP